jgi:CHAT domain-containing protein
MLDIRKEALGEKHLSYVAGLYSLAALYQTTGEFAKAEPLFHRVLTAYKQALGEDHPDYVSTQQQLALLYASTKEPERGVPLARDAMRSARARADRVAAIQSERQQLATAQKLRLYLNGFLTVTAAAKTPGDQVYPEVLAWKGAVLTRQLSLRGLHRGLKDKNPEIAKQYAALADAGRKLATLSLANPDAAKQAERLRAMEQLSEEIERVERSLAAVSAEFREHLAQRRRTAADIAKALPAGAVLVDFLEYEHITPARKGQAKESKEQRLAAFVVRADRPTVRVDLGPIAPLAKSIDEWRSICSRWESGGKDDPRRQLRRLIWEPLAPHVQDARTILVSPDGATARLPLAALPGEKTGTYLIEERAFAVIPVPQLLPELLARMDGTDSAPSLLVVGEVSFDGASMEVVAASEARSAPRAGRGDEVVKWQPLPGTREEIVAIKDSFQRRYRKGLVTDLREEEATEEAIRQQVPRHRYLHLATHGFFAPKQLRSALTSLSGSDGGCGCSLFGRKGVAGFHPGLLSGLVLAGANRPVPPDRDDGILTALEVSALDLSGVDLATLSACETGLGETAGGEGLLGLQRAFQVAGARSVVASLWQVDDKATRDLMTRFYENLWKRKMPKLEALRQAQLWMLKDGAKRGMIDVKVPKERLAKEDGRLPPYYWAAFALSGDWR